MDFENTLREYEAFIGHKVTDPVTINAMQKWYEDYTNNANK